MEPMNTNKSNKNDLSKINTRIDALPTKANWWMKFYLFILLPILILYGLYARISCFILGLYDLSLYAIFIYYLFFEFLLLILTFIFLLKAKKLGYYLNFALIAIESISIFQLISFILPDSPRAYFYILIVGTAAAVSWFILNFIYFQKRRYIFFDEYTKDINSYEELKEKYSAIINKEAAKKAADDKFKLRLDEYNKDKKWLKNYFYIFMPICIAAEAVYIFAGLYYICFVSKWFDIAIIKLAVILVFTIVTFVYVRKINLRTGYYLNIILLVVEWYFSALIFILIFGLLFTILNLIYFTKRKDFFFDEKAEIDKA